MASRSAAVRPHSCLVLLLITVTRRGPTSRKSFPNPPFLSRAQHLDHLLSIPFDLHGLFMTAASLLTLLAALLLSIVPGMFGCMTMAQYLAALGDCH